MRNSNSHGLFAALGAILAALVSATAPAAAAELISVRFGAHEASKTRVVLDIAGPVEYVLAGDRTGQGRIVLDIGALSVLSGREAAGEGHVARYRLEPGKEGARVLLELSRTARIKEHFLLPPRKDVPHHRLVIDLETADMSGFLASLPRRYQDLTPVLQALSQEEAEPAPAPPPVVVPEPLPIIVIDPGHGGGDPGAIGPNGTQEKLVTLAAAEALKTALEKTGRYQVVLTRDGDSRIGLDGRSRAAREAGANLFISLHADAHGDKALRGGSVYTLSEEGSARSAREARNQTNYRVFDVDISAQSPEVGGILFDLAQRKTKNESSRFAEMLVGELNGVIPLVNNSHRTADLFVLLSPDVPAVLLELGFISNRADEANLSSPAWREKAMAAVVAAIDQYFEGRRQTRHAANAAAQAR